LIDVGSPPRILFPTLSQQIPQLIIQAPANNDWISWTPWALTTIRPNDGLSGVLDMSIGLLVS
jgi:hypothetical protein